MEFKTHDKVNTPEGSGKIAWPLNAGSYMVTLDASGDRKAFKKADLQLRVPRPGLVRTRHKFFEVRSMEDPEDTTDPERGYPYGIPV